MTVKNYKKLALLSILGLVAPPVYAEPETTEPDKSNPVDIEAITKKWKCKYCPDLSEEQWEGYFSLGLGYVSNDSYKFGEYNGLYEKGAYIDGELDALYRDDEGNYWNFRGENLGLDSPYLGIEGGRQGTYKLKLEVDQITRYSLDTSRTPYNGSSPQTLPTTWVPGATTADFTSLASDLRDINFSTQRRHFVLAGEYNSSPHWSYGLKFKRQTKEGNQPTGLGFGFSSVAMLSQPIDYTTDEIELSTNYHYSGFTGKIALLHSKFKNQNDAFIWENAFTGPPGATEGQAGTAPDNTKQQLLFTGNYLGVKDLQLTGLFSIAQMSQDEAFLPYTVNDTLTPPDLPTTSLDGKVLVINTNLAAHWQNSSRQQWHFIFEHHEQDNSTARNTYTYVTTDRNVTGTPRANFPYSFRNQKLKINTDYKFGKQVKLSGGGQFAVMNRDYQSVEKTQEGTLWAKIKHRIDNELQYSVRGEYSDRSIDNYNVVSELNPADNPLMRKYNMADRNGQKLIFNLGYSATSSLFLNFSSDIAQYDYDATTIGLIDSNEFSIGLDAQYMVDEDLSFSVFIQNTDIESKQAGFDTFTTTNWTANNDDNVITAGLGANYQVIEDKFKIGIDYIHAESSAAIDISGGEPFPDLTTKRDTFILYGDYHIDEQFTLKASYQYEDYSEDNWYIDGVAPDTLDNVLTYGETAPDYGIGVLWLTLRYRFDNVGE